MTEDDLDQRLVRVLASAARPGVEVVISTAEVAEALRTDGSPSGLPAEHVIESRLDSLRPPM